MNIGNNRFTNIPPSVCLHGEYSCAGNIIPNCASLPGLDLPLLSQEPDKVNGSICKTSVALHSSFALVSTIPPFPMAAQLEQSNVCKVNDCRDTVGAGWNATKLKCDASSVVSFGSDSNGSCKSADVSGSGPINTSRQLLHRACQLFPNSPEIIQSALLDDIEAIRRCEKLASNSNLSGSKMAVKRRCRISEPYTLPINIALKNKADLRVLKILVDAGADTVEFRDGHEKSTSLHIALRMKPNDVSIIDLLLLSNANCAMVSDRHHNYPLHIACSKGSCLDIVHHLYSVYPSAFFMKNFNGETPLDIAQRRSLCPEEVLNFLQSKSFKNCR